MVEVGEARSLPLGDGGAASSDRAPRKLAAGKVLESRVVVKEVFSPSDE